MGQIFWFETTKTNEDLLKTLFNANEIFVAMNAIANSIYLSIT